MKLFTPAAVVSTLAVLLQGAFATADGLERRATVCNGHAELCEKSFGAVTFVGAHDSYAIGTGLAANQDQDITRQLDDGIRMLQMQAHNESGVIKLCHTTCVLLDGGTLEDYLTTVKTWLDANPNEVLSLLIVNIDNVPASSYGTVFAKVGLDTMSYAPETTPLGYTEWPTLGALIDSGKRLLTFIDNQADSAAVPYLIDEFTNIWETEFNVIDATRFDCSVNRTRGDTATQMFMINHFLDKIVLGAPVPFVERLNVTNAASGDGSLGAHVEVCRTKHSRAPNFLLVDFYEYGGGSVFQVAADINGVTYSPSQAIATPKGSSASSTSTGSSSSSTGNSGNGASVNMFPGGTPLTLSSLVAGLILAGGALVL